MVLWLWRHVAKHGTMPAMMITGSCLCGAVAYEAEHLTGDVADICHCSQCRKASGAASLPWVQVAASRFRVTRGAARAYASSAHSTRWFCGDCGAQLYMTDNQNRSVGITLGTLDHPEDVPPTVHGWVSARIAWEVLDDTLPCYDKAPPYDDF